jgi:hypothetical protein
MLFPDAFSGLTFARRIRVGEGNRRETMTSDDEALERRYPRGTLTLAVAATLGGMLLAIGVLREARCAYVHPFVCEVPALARTALHSFEPGLLLMLALLLRLLWLRLHDLPPAQRSLARLRREPIAYLAGLIAAVLAVMLADNGAALVAALVACLWG